MCDVDDIMVAWSGYVQDIEHNGKIVNEHQLYDCCLWQLLSPNKGIVFKCNNTSVDERCNNSFVQGLQESCQAAVNAGLTWCWVEQLNNKWTTTKQNFTGLRFNKYKNLMVFAEQFLLLLFRNISP